MNFKYLTRFPYDIDNIQVNRIAWLLIILLCLVLRRPDAVYNPQLWAEDGTVFFKPNVYHQPSFFTPYAGYLHFVPRIVAYVSSFAPFNMIPFLYMCATVIITLYVAYSIMAARWVLPFKPLLALWIVLAPHSGEVFLNLTNIQWITSLLLLILVLQKNPVNRFQLVSDLIILVLTGLTGPFVILLLPFFLKRVFSRGNNFYNLLMFSLAVILSCIQLYFLFNLHMSDCGYPLTGLNQLLKILGYRFAGTLFFAVEKSVAIHGIILVLTMLGCLLFIFYFSKDSKYKEHVTVFIGFGLIVCSSALYKIASTNELGKMENFIEGDRYLYIFRLMVTWSLVLLLENKNKVVRAMVIVMLSLAVLSSITWYSNFQYVDYDWRHYSKQLENDVNLEKSHEIPINPKDWYITITPRVKKVILDSGNK